MGGRRCVPGSAACGGAVKGTHPAVKCATCGRIAVYAPSSVSDAAVRSEIKRIEHALTDSRPAVDLELRRINKQLDALELDVGDHRRSDVGRRAAAASARDELAHYAQVLAELEIVRG